MLLRTGTAGSGSEPETHLLLSFDLALLEPSAHDDLHGRTTAPLPQS